LGCVAPLRRVASLHTAASGCIAIGRSTSVAATRRAGARVAGASLAHAAATVGVTCAAGADRSTDQGRVSADRGFRGIGLTGSGVALVAGATFAGAFGFEATGTTDFADA